MFVLTVGLPKHGAGVSTPRRASFNITAGVLIRDCLASLTLEERIAGLEGSYRELTKRIDDLREETHRGLDALRSGMADLRGEIVNLRGEFANLRNESRNESMSSRNEARANFRWIMSLVLVNWLSIPAGFFLAAGRN